MRMLTIAELWAIPQMLRIALIEGIQDLAARGLTELRDRETADFWANRLITANRRDPNHLFAIMAELAENQPSPSPYFAFQLIDHLYDEEAALVPVQSWLERIYRKPLSELNSREQNRQTKDQISDQQRLHQPAPACPAGLEADLRAGQRGGTAAAAGSIRHLRPDGFRHA